MAWWQGSDETRLLIAADPHVIGDGAGELISLRHPKSVLNFWAGNTMCCVLVDGMLQELTWFRQTYSSWFLGDYVSEDGGIYTATRVDPVFILLPIFEEARMKKKDDSGKFRPLDEIIVVEGYPGYQQLWSIAEESMQAVCEIKEIDSSKYFRLDDSKVLAWLYHKACQLKQALSTLNSSYAVREEKERLADAVSILAEYVRDKPWLKLLCGRLRIELPEAPKQAPDTETLPTVYEYSPGNWNASEAMISQEKNKSENKVTTRAATGRQAKKMKPETESHNIRDMFSRVSRKK